jgi:predicted metal-binding protein
MKALDFYCQKALEMGMSGAKVIDPRSIVTSEWVRMKCQFGCPDFGMRLCCPPYAPSPDQTRKVIDSYQKAILFHLQYQKAKDKERMKGFDFNQVIVSLEIQIFLDGYYKAWSMGAGPCRLCKECDTSGLCKHGDEARPSMEACGIDVYKTARENGFHIEVVRTHEEERNFYGVILVE